MAENRARTHTHKQKESVQIIQVQETSEANNRLLLAKPPLYYSQSALVVQSQEIAYFYVVLMLNWLSEWKPPEMFSTQQRALCSMERHTDERPSFITIYASGPISSYPLAVILECAVVLSAVNAERGRSLDVMGVRMS